MQTVVNSSQGPGRRLETLTIVTPLGIRFWDLTVNVPVGDGLEVKARRAGAMEPVVVARVTPSGTHVFFGLPGLRALEYPDGSPLQTSIASVLVTVRDRLERFLPTVIAYTIDPNGLAAAGGADRGPRMAYLFSAPTRAVPPGMAAVRATLVEKETGQPARHAVLRVQVADQSEVWTGISDQQGQVLALFPYPLVERLRLGSPPGTGQGSVTEQRWPIKVTARYAPARLRFPLADAGKAAFPFNLTPSLKSVLDEQTPALIWSSTATSVTELSRTLSFGEQLILRTDAGSPPSSSSTLLVSRGASPP